MKAHVQECTNTNKSAKALKKLFSDNLITRINIQKEAEPLNWNNFEASRRAVLLQKVDGSQFHNVSHVVPWSLAPAAAASEVLAMRRNIEAWFSKQPESRASKQLPLGAKLT